MYCDQNGCERLRFTMGLPPIGVTISYITVLHFLVAVWSHLGYSLMIKRNTDPYFLKTSTNITVHEGELAVLKCHVEQLGPKMVSVIVWRKLTEDYPVTIGTMTFAPEDEMSVDHEQVTETRSTWDLLIKNAKPKHAGTYECQVSANHLIAQYVTLNIIKAVERVPELTITGDRIVNMGNKIHLVCNATGVLRAPEEVDWFSKGKRILTSDHKWRGRVEILKRSFPIGKYFISELIIEQSTMEDKGDYVCRTSDLNVNSITILVLDTGKENPRRRDSNKKEQTGGQMRKSDYNSATSSSFIQSYLLIVYSLLAVVMVTIFR